MAAIRCADPSASSPDFPEWVDENELLEDVTETSAAGLSKVRGGANGAADFCNDGSMCLAGEGDCDSNAQCASGLVCGRDNGGRFSPPMPDSTWDVCVPSSCTNAVQDPDESGVDCGSECGSCMPVCNAQGTAGTFYHCSPTCRCASGVGDCDSNAECVAGATCGRNNGASFQLPPNYDVCVAAHCTNAMDDVDETGVDCGGADCAACPMPPTPPAPPLGAITLPPGSRIERVVDDASGRAFIATGPTGLSIRDVSDPNNPTTLGTWTPALAGANCTDLVQVGDKIWLACENHVACVDVSNPANPTEVVANRITAGVDGALACAYLDGALYVGAGTDVRIYDIRDAAFPPVYTGKLGAAQPGETIVRVVVDGRRIYCLYRTAGGSRIYVAGAGGGGNGGSGGGTVFAPQSFGVFAGSQNPTDLAVVGGFVYCAYDGAGLFIYDFRDAASPQFLYSDGGSSTLRISVRGSTLACIYGDRRFAIADVSDPSAPRLLSSDTAGSVPTGVAVLRGGFAFCGYAANISIFDVPPFVVGTSPSAGSTGACAPEVVDVFFSAAMDSASLTGATLRLIGPSGPVSASVTLAGAVATVDPTAPLAAGNYQLQVTGAAENLRGTAISPAAGITTSFVVGTACIQWNAAPATVAGGSAATLDYRVTPTQSVSTRVLFSSNPKVANAFETTTASNVTIGDFQVSWTPGNPAQATDVYAIPTAITGSGTIYGPARKIVVTASAPLTCAAGRGDCDLNPANACEVNLTTSASHCGRCGHDCGGGTCSASACNVVSVATTAGPPYGIGVDDEFMYWTERTTQRIMRAGKNGSSITVLATGVGPNISGITPHEGTVYWATYVSNTIQATGRDLASPPRTLRTDSSPFALGFWGDAMYWTRFLTASPGAVLRASRFPVGAATVLATPPVDRLGGLGVDGIDGLIFLSRASQSQSSGAALSMPIAGGALTQIGSPTGYSGFSALDEKYVYTGNGNAGGPVRRFDRVTGASAVVAAGSAPYGVAVDDAFVYVADFSANTIRRIAKPCENGTCFVCRPERRDCDGLASNTCETDISEDASHCGACGAACEADEACRAGVCAAVQTSCAEIHAASPALGSGTFPIDVDGPGPLPARAVYCDMTTDGGGWTKVMYFQQTRPVPTTGAISPDFLAHALSTEGKLPDAEINLLMTGDKEMLAVLPANPLRWTVATWGGGWSFDETRTTPAPLAHCQNAAGGGSLRRWDGTTATADYVQATNGLRSSYCWRFSWAGQVGNDGGIDLENDGDGRSHAATNGVTQTAFVMFVR